MDQEDGLDDDWHDAVVPPDDQMDDRLSVQTEKLDDEFSDVVIKSESGHVIANDTYDDEYNEYDEEDIPESPPFMDNESEDPDYSEDEMEADTEIDEPLPTRWPITILPEDADLDPVVELERIEEAVDEDGVGAKIWKCKLCDLRFQYYASYAKHNDREHPDGLPAEWWEEDPVVKLDRTFFISDDEDSDFDPKHRVQRKKRVVRKRGAGWTSGKAQSKNQSRGTRNSDRVLKSNRAANKKSAKTVQIPKKKKKPATCPECERVFKSKKYMLSHQKRSHFLPFRCDVCDRGFETFKKYYVHSEMMHDKVVEMKEDQMVSLSDAGESDPEDHRLPLDDVKSLLFPCSLCKRHYVTEIALSGHMIRSHVDEIPDLAVIETHKRQWKTRFEPENVAKHESILEQLGEKGKEAEEVDDELFAVEWKRKTTIEIADGDDKMSGPVIVLPKSKKTREQLQEAYYNRVLRKRKREAVKKGKNPDDICLEDVMSVTRSARKTISEKLETHMAKLARRRVRERKKRIEKRVKEGKAEFAPDGTYIPVKGGRPELEKEKPKTIDPETGELYVPKSKKKKKKKKEENKEEDSEGNLTLKYHWPMKYDGVKDFCRICNMEFENDRLTVEHLKLEHTRYTEEDKKREDEILKNLIPEEMMPPVGNPVPGQEGSSYRLDYSCGQCQKRYMHPYKLAAHMEDDHKEKLIIDGEEISRKCPDELKRTEDQRIVCQMCGKKIRRRSIRMHVLRIHAGEPFRKAYPCDQCDKSYPVANQCFWHRRKAHMSTVLTCCEICGKEITSPRQLKVHMRVHEGYMFACKHCGEKFKSTQGCVNHEKRHTEKMNFECKFCAKRFWWPRDVNKHERNVHADGIVQHDKIAINREKDWEAESIVNAKKMRYLTDNPRAPNGTRKVGRPPKSVASVSEDSSSQTQDFVPATGHMTRAQSTAAQAAKEAVVTTRPQRKTRAQKKREQEHEQMRAIESLDLDGLEEQVEYSGIVHDHLSTSCQQVLTIPQSHLSQQHHQMQGLGLHHAGQQMQHQSQYLHAMQNAVSHTMNQSQMFLNSCMQQQQVQYQVPLIPGDCKLCRVRTNDLRSHYSEVHKVLPDVLQHFL